jgi:signal transduction histidine kinase
LSNKLDALGGVETLRAILQKATNATRETQRSKLLIDAEKRVEKLVQARADLKELVWAYSRMVSDDLEQVDTNAVVSKVKLQLETKAQEAKVRIILKKASDLPPAKAIQSRLEQVVANLVLNAIQQIEKQCYWMAQVAQQRNDQTLLMPGGIVIVQTRHKEPQSPYPIEIVVTDTGPGIHYHRQEKIFLMDTSTRSKGQGLGLFISRNLIETMGGRLRLVDSVMFMGSAFVVELPAF